MEHELSRIEARLDAYAALLASADTDEEISDYVTIDKSRWTLATRLNATHGAVRVELTDSQFIKGWVRGVGQDHVELSVHPDSAMLHAIVRLSACRGVSFLAQSQRELPAVPRTLNAALRLLAHARVSVSVLSSSGAAISGHLLAAHADHIELGRQGHALAVPLPTISAVIVIG